MPNVDLSHVEPEVAKAINDALDEVRAKPRDAKAWGRLGMYLRAHDFESECLIAFKTASELDPADFRWPYLEGKTLIFVQPEKGLERLRKAAELAPATRPEPRLVVADLLLQRGDLNGAAEQAEAVVKSNRDNARAQLALARVAAGKKDWAAVIECANASSLDSRCRRSAALLRAEAYASRGESENSDAEFRKLATLPESPGWPDPIVEEVESLRVGTSARLAKADDLLNQGRGDEALRLLDQAALASPNSPGPTLKLGQTYILAGQWKEARRVLEPFAIRFPGSVEGWFNLGVARFQIGDVATAAEAFRETLRLKSDHARAHFNLGHCHRKLGDKSLAKTEFEEALRCKPDYEAVRQAIAEINAGK